jgi:hypothetical protein
MTKLFWPLWAFSLILLAAAFLRDASAQQSVTAPATITVEFTNPGITPPHWTLTFRSDGSGQFDAEGAQSSGQDRTQVFVGDIHRAIQLSPEFTDRTFALARERKFFDFPCESHMKVAFQGTKRLSYSGPDGKGMCEFNYSKDKQIEQQGNAFMSVENTVLFGARLEKLLQHDRLGLDKEMESLAVAAHDGNAIEIGVIRETLTKIASDDEVLERARRKARLLLTQDH